MVRQRDEEREQENEIAAAGKFHFLFLPFSSSAIASLPPNLDWGLGLGGGSTDGQIDGRMDGWMRDRPHLKVAEGRHRHRQEAFDRHRIRMIGCVESVTCLIKYAKHMLFEVLKYVRGVK